MQEAIAQQIYCEAKRRSQQLAKLTYHIYNIKLAVQPSIPAEFKVDKLPPAISFAPDVFSLKDLKESYQFIAKQCAQLLDEKTVAAIDKEFPLV